MEAVVFVGGVSLGQPATAIPIAAIVGIICGLIIGYFIYAFASRTSKHYPIHRENSELNTIYDRLDGLSGCDDELLAFDWFRVVLQGCR